MSSVACGQPLSLAHLPCDKVIRLAGLTDDQLAISLDPLPAGAPVVIRHRFPEAVTSSQHVVEEVLGRLQSIAVELFPAWLPEADVITEASDFDRRIVRELARRRAATSLDFGPFLVDLADVALGGRSTMQRFGPEVRARGLARVIGDSYARTGVVLLVGPVAPPSSAEDQRRIASACEWLAGHAIGTWLSSDALSAVDRFPTWQLPVPAYVDAFAIEEPDEPPPAIDYPALAGMPHPASAVEQALERSLARCAWAVGRTWNQEYVSHSLAPPIRVDLMWPGERCVVEIDGPDHRGVLKYAADRRRDNGLALDGFAVLRFTNDEITDDPQRVLSVIERLLVTKRHCEGTQL